MDRMKTVIGVVAITLLLAACAKKEEAAPMPAAPPVAAPVEPAPVVEQAAQDAQDNDEDAAHSGGDKVDTGTAPAGD